jgi:CHAT domain-containing protein
VQNSGRVLADEPDGGLSDGMLSARSLLHIPLSARLAVLSACETGRGVVQGGEGLMGLAWAFRAAGVPAVLASQWQVDDEATRQLMVAFYKAMKAGMTKDDALRAAMLAVQTSKPSPYYWAAFELIGDSSPLRF